MHAYTQNEFSLTRFSEDGDHLSIDASEAAVACAELACWHRLGGAGTMTHDGYTLMQELSSMCMSRCVHMHIHIYIYMYIYIYVYLAVLLRTHISCRREYMLLFMSMLVAYTFFDARICIYIYLAVLLRIHIFCRHSYMLPHRSIVFQIRFLESEYVLKYAS